MKFDFLVTNIQRIIMVDKNEYAEKITHFKSTSCLNEIIFHFSGQATVNFNGKIIKTTPNSVRFLPKGRVDEYTVDRKEHGECILVVFDADKIVADRAFVLKLHNNNNIGAIFKKLFSVWVAKNDGYYFESLSLIYKIFAELQKQNYIPENQYNKIKPALKYIEENFAKNKIPANYLADICGISESYLKKLFIKKYGISPIKYINGLKLNYACDLLKSGLYNITQISEMCGYTNLYFFSRQFKDYIGISPTEFQNKYKSSK